MGKRGSKPKGKVKIQWSQNFAYAIGLIVSDGSLSKTGRHISFVSKDLIQIKNFLKALQITHIKTGRVIGENDSKAYRVQFGDVLFYQFLESIGIMNNKSKKIAEISIPKKYFRDFLRGLFDGDGYSYSYWDKRWSSSFMFYVCFVSASPDFIKWLQITLKNILQVGGHITTQGRNKNCFQLKYAKKEGLIIKKYMYYKNMNLFLPRKRLKIEKSLDIVGKSGKKP